MPLKYIYKMRYVNQFNSPLDRIGFDNVISFIKISSVVLRNKAGICENLQTCSVSCNILCIGGSVAIQAPL